MIGILPVLHRLDPDNRLPPVFVITPNGNDCRGSSPWFDSDYDAGPNGKMGPSIGSELPAVGRERHRPLEGPQFWAIGGLLSGDGGALNIGLQHLDQFNIFFSKISYFSDSSRRANSPQDFISDIPTAQRQNRRLYMDAGLNDLTGPQLLISTRRFHATLDRLGVANVMQAFPDDQGLSGADDGWNHDHQHAFDSLSYVGVNLKLALEKQAPE